MTHSNQGTGWYADPTGQHELRYFDGQWTDHVSDNGVVSKSPVTPVAPAGPAAPAPRFSRGKIIVAACIAAGAAVATVIVVSSGRGSGTNVNGFCRDYPQLESFATSDPADIGQAAKFFSKLAAEAPSSAKSDLRLLAADEQAVLDGNADSVDNDAAEAAADRVDKIATSTCSGD